MLCIVRLAHRASASADAYALALHGRQLQTFDQLNRVRDLQSNVRQAVPIRYRPGAHGAARSLRELR
jgi:hypothetical protein